MADQILTSYSNQVLDQVATEVWFPGQVPTEIVGQSYVVIYGLGIAHLYSQYLRERGKHIDIHRVNLLCENCYYYVTPSEKKEARVNLELPRPLRA